MARVKGQNILRSVAMESLRIYIPVPIKSSCVHVATKTDSVCFFLHTISASSIHCIPITTRMQNANSIIDPRHKHLLGRKFEGEKTPSSSTLLSSSITSCNNNNQNPYSFPPRFNPERWLNGYQPNVLSFTWNLMPMYREDDGYY